MSPCIRANVRRKSRRNRNRAKTTQKGKTTNEQGEQRKKYRGNTIAMLSFVTVATDHKDHYNNISNSNILNSTKDKMKARTSEAI